MDSTPPFTRAALQGLNNASRANQLARVVEKNVKIVYDQVVRRAREGQTVFRWEDWNLQTDVELTNQERLQVKVDMKMALLAKFPDCRVSVDEAFTYLQFDWGG
jgi:hypothetical protein